MGMVTQYQQGGGGGQNCVRYEDPWEVSIVQDQGTVLTSAKLGRSLLGPVSAHSAHSLVETFAAERDLDLISDDCDATDEASSQSLLSYRQSQGLGFVDVFGLKDLAPQKFRNTASSASMEVYSVIRLVRNGNRKLEPKRAWSDTLLTPAKRVEPVRTSASSPSEYMWRDQAGSERSLLQPPRKLHLSVYETRFFSDHKLGDLELPLSSLTDERALRDWLPLSSDKGAAWFVHVQLQLRFLLMAIDSDKDNHDNNGELDPADADSLSGGLRRYQKKGNNIKSKNKGMGGGLSFPDIKSKLSRKKKEQKKKDKEIEQQSLSQQQGVDGNGNGSSDKSSSSGVVSGFNNSTNNTSPTNNNNNINSNINANSNKNVSGKSTDHNMNNNTTTSATATTAVTSLSLVAAAPSITGSPSISNTTTSTTSTTRPLHIDPTMSISTAASVSSVTTTSSSTSGGVGVGVGVGVGGASSQSPGMVSAVKTRFRPSAISRLEELGDFF
eukprot:gene3367-6667_t